MRKLNVEFREGRSAKAPELHALEFAERLKNPKNDGIQTDKGKRLRQAGVRDIWESAGYLLIRVHNRPRGKVFTPIDIKPDAQLSGTRVQTLRVTWGFHEDGTSFCTKDSWTNLGCANHVTVKPWTGYSVFQCSIERPESIGGISPRGVSKT